MVILCLIFYRTALVSSITAVPFYIPASKIQGFQHFHILTIFCCCFHIKAILVDARWYFTLVLICISLMIFGLSLQMHCHTHNGLWGWKSPHHCLYLWGKWDGQCGNACWSERWEGGERCASLTHSTAASVDLLSKSVLGNKRSNFKIEALDTWNW